MHNTLEVDNILVTRKIIGRIWEGLFLMEGYLYYD